MKKWLTLLIALVLTLGLTACGADSSSDREDDPKPSHHTKDGDPSQSLGDWRMTGKTDFNADGSISRKIKYEYDANGNEIKRTSFAPDGSMYWWNEYEYDAQGNQIKLTQFEPDGSINNWTEYEYGYIG